jgi:hypothetical protein
MRSFDARDGDEAAGGAGEVTRAAGEGEDAWQGGEEAGDDDGDGNGEAQVRRRPRGVIIVSPIYVVGQRRTLDGSPRTPCHHAPCAVHCIMRWARRGVAQALQPPFDYDVLDFEATAYEQQMLLEERSVRARLLRERSLLQSVASYLSATTAIQDAMVDVPPDDPVA